MTITARIAVTAYSLVKVLQVRLRSLAFSRLTGLDCLSPFPGQEHSTPVKNLFLDKKRPGSPPGRYYLFGSRITLIIL